MPANPEPYWMQLKLVASGRRVLCGYDQTLEYPADDGEKDPNYHDGFDKGGDSSSSRNSDKGISGVLVQCTRSSRGASSQTAGVPGYDVNKNGYSVVTVCWSEIL
ncbi:hypothetical protein PI124_g8053 [Phytophthora idaei]|nr:hypothetical protein PI124_g8053 [Phytophthora idaei]